MKIKIITPWKQDKLLGEIEGEYIKRIGRFASIELVELKGERGEGSRAVKKEGQRLLQVVGQGSLLVAMTERGSSYDSPAFSRWLEETALNGRSDYSFVIGSASGLDDALVNRADLKLSLSSMTLPHRLARLVLIEQIYRALTLIKGGPYHK